jgi:hypothetical protein
MKYLGHLAILLQAAIVMAEPAPQVDLRDQKAVRQEVDRIQKKYQGDPARAAEEVSKFNEKVADANGWGDELRALRARRRQLAEKYGNPANFRKLIDDQTSRTIDFSAWRWVVDRTEDRYILTMHLDRERYKDLAPIVPQVVLRGKGGNREEEEDLQNGMRKIDVLTLKLAYDSPGNNVFRVEFSCPEAELSRYVIQISARLEPDWEVCGVIDLSKK